MENEHPKQHKDILKAPKRNMLVALIDADEFVEFEGYDLELREYNAWNSVDLVVWGEWRITSQQVVLWKIIQLLQLILITGRYGLVLPGSAKCFANLNQDCKLKNIHQIYGAVGMDGSVYPGYKVFKKAWIRHYYKELGRSGYGELWV